MAIVSLPSAEDNHLETLATLSPDLALREAVPFLVRLASNPDFLDAHVLPLLGEAQEAKEWYIAHSWEGQDDSYCLRVFVWPPQTRTKIHNHTCWGAYCCVVGSILVERYERLDDGWQEGHARLRKVRQLVWSKGDGASAVLLYKEGIHRVGNVSASPAISVHLYGPQMGEVDGRDCDPSRDYVCDRVDAKSSQVEKQDWKEEALCRQKRTRKRRAAFWRRPSEGAR